MKIDFIQRDKFIEHPSAKDVLDILMDIYDAPCTERPWCLSVLGATNTGKTALIGEFTRRVQRKTTAGLSDTVPLVVVDAPARCTAAQLELELADVLGAPVTNYMQARHVTEMIKGDMRDNRVRMLIIQEFNHVLDVSEGERKLVFDTIKTYANRRIHVILVSTPGIEEALRVDPQIRNRFKPIKLQGFVNNDAFRSFLASLEAEYPFAQPSRLWDDDLANFIHARTKGVIGEAVSLCNFAAVDAVKKGKPCIDFDSLANNRDYIAA